MTIIKKERNGKFSELQVIKCYFCAWSGQMELIENTINKCPLCGHNILFPVKEEKTNPIIVRNNKNHIVGQEDDGYPD